MNGVWKRLPLRSLTGRFADLRPQIVGMANAWLEWHRPFPTGKLAFRQLGPPHQDYLSDPIRWSFVVPGSPPGSGSEVLVTRPFSVLLVPAHLAVYSPAW